MAVLPQLGIIVLGLFSIIYTFIAGHIAWDFYLLNVIWIAWVIWTMSGICLAAIKRHKWPEEEVFEEGNNSFFFFPNQRIVCDARAVDFVTLFFVTVDPSKMDHFFSNLRCEILQSVGFENPCSRIYTGNP